YIRNGQSVWSERVEMNSQGLISRINDSSIEYDNNLIPTLNEGRVRSRRNQRGQVESLNGEELNWVGDNLYSVDGESNYYDENGSLVASCPAGSSFGQNECFIRYQPDYISFAGNNVKLITVGGFKVGALVNNQFYPLIENYLGSVVGVLSQDGAEFLVERSYSVWGLRKTKTHSDLGKELDRLVVWSFAGLFTNPVIDSQLDVYWSNSRAYSPKLQQWLSIDPLVKYGPYNLLKVPGNWHGERYANNDP